MTGQRYTAEFKAEALKQVVEHGSVKEVAQRLGIGSKTLYLWRQEAGLGRDATAVTKDADLQRENQRLKAELRRVTEERDILKKAAAYFAKTSG
jgi:transposase